MSSHYHFYLADWNLVLERAKNKTLDADRLHREFISETDYSVLPEQAHWLEEMDCFLSKIPYSNATKADGIYDCFRELLPFEMQVETDRFFIAIDPVHNLFYQEQPGYHWTP